MAPFDLLILIVYVTFMVYVLYRARQSVIDQKLAQRKQARAGKVLVTLGQDALTQDLERQLATLNLSDRIQLTLDNRMVVGGDCLDRFTLTIKNRTTTYAAYINWQESSLTDLRGQSRSLARITPNEGLSRSTTMVAPGQQFRESLTVWTGDRPLNLVDAAFLMGRVTAVREGEVACKISLSLSIGLKAVGNFQANHFLAVSCPIEFRNPTLDDIQGKNSNNADLAKLLQSMRG